MSNNKLTIEKLKEVLIYLSDYFDPNNTWKEISNWVNLTRQSDDVLLVVNFLDKIIQPTTKLKELSYFYLDETPEQEQSKSHK